MLKLNNPLISNPTMSFPKEWQKYFDNEMMTAKSCYSKKGVPPSPIIPSLATAIAVYLEQSKGSIGIALLTNGYVAAEFDDGVSTTQICVVNEKTGEIRASAVNNITHQKSSLVLDTSLPTMEGVMYSAGEVVWLAIMPQILDEPEAQLAMKDLEEAVNTGDNDTVQRALSVLNDNVFTRATDNSLAETVKLSIQNVGEKGPLKEVSLDKIASGEYQVSCVIKGRMNLFETTHYENKGTVKIEKGQYSLGVANDARVQSYMIDDLKGYKTTQMVDDICRIVTLGKDKPELKISNFYLIGPPGAGKSEDAKAAAYHLGLPFYVLGLSSGVTEETLSGVILPSLGENVLSDEEKAAVEAVTGLFPSEMAIDITPEIAFEKITGEKRPDIDVLTVYQEAYSKLLAFAKRIEKEPSKGVSYMYVPSPLVLAARFGGVIEIQEASSPSDPACLSYINEFMNKPDGVLNTPIGQIRRHENCIVIMTDNFATDIGYSPMNQAVKDRAGAISFWYENPSPQEMVERAEKSGITIEKDTLFDMAETIAIMSEVAADPGNSIKATAGYRSFLNWAKAVQMGFTVRKGFELAVINKMATNPEERELLIDASAGTPIQ